MAGIVVKVWNISAGATKTSAGQIADSLNYITDSEKCDILMDSSIAAELDYVGNDAKTLMGVYKASRHIVDTENAAAEMMQVKVYWGKTDGRLILHGIISLEEGESDPKNAGKLMLLMDDVLKEVFPDHQAVYAVHTNTENLHVHFVVNTVGLNGKKIHMDKKFMKETLEPAVNRAAVRYGFTPNSEWAKKKTEYMDMKAAKMKLRELIDISIENSGDFATFIACLRDSGVTVNIGRTMTVKCDGMARPINSMSLGAEYGIERIAERIRHKEDELYILRADTLAEKPNPGQMGWFSAEPLRRFAELSEEQKEYVIRELKNKRNPWMKRRDTNWRVTALMEDYRTLMQADQIMRAYGKANDRDGAMQEIIVRQKELDERRSEIRKHLREHKTEIDLYKHMEKRAANAMLYELGHDEFYDDFENYRLYGDRLEQGYRKSPLQYRIRIPCLTSFTMPRKRRRQITTWW